MSYCRLCDVRPATTYTPWKRRPCCEKCLRDLVKTLAAIKTGEALGFLNLKDSMQRHPAGKGPRYRWRDLRSPDIRID